jgi:hypothetical protein
LQAGWLAGQVFFHAQVSSSFGKLSTTFFVSKLTDWRSMTSAPASEPRSFGRCACMAAPNAPRPQSTQRRSPVPCDLSASSVWNTQARRVLCVCLAALRSTEPWPRHLHGSSQPATPPLIAEQLSAPSSFGRPQCMATPTLGGHVKWLATRGSYPAT